MLVAKPTARTWEAARPALQRALVHQATGMLSVEFDLPVLQALLRRAHACSSGRSITDITRGVVDRRLRLDQRCGGTPPSV